MEELRCAQSISDVTYKQQCLSALTRVSTGSRTEDITPAQSNTVTWHAMRMCDIRTFCGKHVLLLQLQDLSKVGM